jgi:hypothetical protein
MTYKLTNTSQPADPYYGAVSLLLHGDGADGSTQIIDNSPNPKTVTVNGNAQISTTESKFNGSSLKFDGNGDYIDADASSPDFELGSDDFTIETWVLFNSNSPNDGCIISKHAPFTPHWVEIRLGSTQGAIITQVSFDGTSWGMSYQSTDLVATNTWYHIALVRSGSVFTTYIDGVANGTASSASSISNNTSYPLRLGARGNADQPLDGYIDDLRITKGVARYTSNFTPPSQPFLNTSNIVINGLVLNLDAATYPGSGTTWSDSSGNGNNGTLQNTPTYVNENGGSFYFDGTNEWVSGPGYDISSDYSFSMWFKIDTLSITHYLISGGTAFFGNYNIILTTSGIVAVARSGSPVVSFSEFVASIDTIYQIVVTKSGTSYNLYVNGSNVSSKTFDNSALYYSPNRLFANEWGGGLFNGSVYRTSAYNRELTAAEVSQNFNALKGRFGL